MAKLLHNGEWYDQVAPSALYEGEFENIVLQQAEDIFPEFFVVPFKCLVVSDQGAHRPDLALIDRKYRSWWVIEVELAHHSLLGHVLPQVQTFATGEYGEAHAKHLCGRRAELDPNAIRGMLKGQPPQVLVVVNAPCPDWVPVLHRLNALLTIFEIFRSRFDRQVFRLNGEQPSIPSNVISVCEFDQTLPRFLRVHSPAAFPCADGEVVRIYYDGAITSWKRVDAQDSVWLIPIGADPLTPGKQYEIVRDESRRLSIRPAETRR